MTERVAKYDSQTQTIRITIRKPPEKSTKWLHIPFLIGAGIFGVSALEKAYNREYTLAAGLAIASINMFTTQYLLANKKKKNQENQSPAMPISQKTPLNGGKLPPAKQQKHRPTYFRNEQTLEAISSSDEELHSSQVDKNQANHSRALPRFERHRSTSGNWPTTKEDKTWKLHFRIKPTLEEFTSSEDELPALNSNRCQKKHFRSRPTLSEFTSSEDELPALKPNKCQKKHFRSRSSRSEFDSGSDKLLAAQPSPTTIPISPSSSDSDWVLVERP